MASRLFYDPHKLLVVAPLITSACSFWFAVDQHIFLSNFQNPAHRDKSNAILPSYFEKFLPQALKAIFALNGLSAATAIANLATRGDILRRTGANRWYWSGLLFSLAHFAFVPAVAWKIKDIIDDNTKGQSTGVLAKWLNVHYLRMFTVDLLAFGSFLAGTLAAVTL